MFQIDHIEKSSRRKYLLWYQIHSRISGNLSRNGSIPTLAVIWFDITTVIIVIVIVLIMVAAEFLKENEVQGTEFTITDQHLKLSRHMYMGWNDRSFGAPSIDPKRPYGSNDIYASMVGILELGETSNEDGEYSPETENKLQKLHMEMETALQIFLVTGEIKAGTYVRDNNYDAMGWRRKET